MTNVPQKIRDAWKEIYVLFDMSYGSVDGTEEAWTAYWNKASEIYEKYKQDIDLTKIIEAVVDMLEQGIEHNKTLFWKADEDYPYPKTKGG